MGEVVGVSFISVVGEKVDMVGMGSSFFNCIRGVLVGSFFNCMKGVLVGSFFNCVWRMGLFCFFSNKKMRMVGVWRLNYVMRWVQISCLSSLGPAVTTAKTGRACCSPPVHLLCLAMVMLFLRLVD